VPGQYNQSDCSEIGVQPYTQIPTSELGYQLISPGRNKAFGMKGDQWTPGNATTTYQKGSDGADDLTNFSNSPLGAKQ